ncbi:SRPBCC domain-containing protein [Tenacibaculum xiamenense]|uniref:SRPBCC domain-containing protein n=1 Tax=Tenacibaculum xiamenense TaxID=1261553 RepID=UPI003893371D
MSLLVEVKSNIKRNIKEVFKAIIDKEEIAKYFVTSSSSNLIEGALVTWNWEDVCAEHIVEVVEIRENERIVFMWSANQVRTKVKILLEELSQNQTSIKIEEKQYEKTDEGITKVMQQTQGWTDFICSLKAYLYTGINLRTGVVNRN